MGTSNIEKLDSSQRKLEKSKTEAPRHRNILAEEAAQIFDNKIPAQQKVLSFLDESPIPLSFVSIYIYKTTIYFLPHDCYFSFRCFRRMILIA